ncbi:MAG: DNA modification methylase [Agriterribacter sp.]
MTSTALSSRVIKTELVSWKDFHFVQNDNLKELGETERSRLKSSILADNFIQPFYVWQDPTDNVIYCLDGRHRSLILNELISEGHDIPELLPATFIHCGSKTEAARLVLIYSSIYARITQQGLFDFLEMYELEYEDITSQMSLPEFSTDRFEQKFNVYDLEEIEEEEPFIPDDPIVQPGDIFEINGHRVICASFKDPEAVDKLMQGRKARILNCDPPYNLPADFFLKDNKHNHQHKDFAEGAGEMTDEQFVDFLALVMATGVMHTVPGAIHYVFMDFRHVWHMTEAAYKVYGTREPKQICVWNKDIMANGSFYRAKHELCFAFTNNKAKHLWNNDLLDHGGFYKDNNELVFIFKSGDDDVKHLSHLDLKDRIRTNVWNYPSANSTANEDRYELKNHPTPKPVKMIADSILDTTNPGDIVIDWFLGSGTCLIACEKTNRFCYATEIEPRYVQSDILRLLKFCNKYGIDVKYQHVNGRLTVKDFFDAETQQTLKATRTQQQNHKN